MSRSTATTAKPLSLAARKAAVAKIAENAPAKARAGIGLIDFRPPPAKAMELGAKIASERRAARAA